MQGRGLQAGDLNKRRTDHFWQALKGVKEGLNGQQRCLDEAL